MSNSKEAYWRRRTRTVSLIFGLFLTFIICETGVRLLSKVDADGNVTFLSRRLKPFQPPVERLRALLEKIGVDHRFGIDSDVLRVGADETLVEDTARKVLEVVAFECVEVTHVDLGGLRDLPKGDLTQFPFAPEFFAEGGHGGFLGRARNGRPQTWLESDSRDSPKWVSTGALILIAFVAT